MQVYEFNDFSGDGKSIIKIDNNTLSISRPGLLSKFSHGFSGEKTFMINQISAVQVKKAGFARGYIQFVMAGTSEVRSGIFYGHKHENIVYFSASSFTNKRTNEQAMEIKKYIEEYNSKLNTNANTTIIKKEDKYDKLAKLKSLLDNNVITQEEFDREKQKILQ